MRIIVLLWLLVIAPAVVAVGPPVPAQFMGVWVPLGSTCSADRGLRVGETTVTLFNGADAQQFGDLDICHSCEGGARYGGVVVWVLPEFGAGRPAPFTVRFNANEERGVTIVEIGRDDLRRRFPLHNVKLRRCQ